MLQGNGLEINGVKISLDDAQHEVCFVSHAHSDHTSAFSKGKRIIASKETFAIMGKEAHIAPSLPVRLHRAGHMLGARQLFAECDGAAFAYTGDFSLHDSYSARGAEILKCDTLMVDSTYCLPHLRMPNRYQVMASMERFVKQNSDSVLVFGAYTTGKAQEIVAFLNRECRVAPVVGKRAAGVCAAYGKCGVRLDYIEAGSEEAEEQMRHPFAAIMPPREVNHSFAARLSAGLGKKVKTAVATGWAAVTKFPVDAAFALSDHADFADTMRYIGESGAKRVICANSNSSEAAAYLRSVGIDAASKEELGEGKGRQKTLATC